MFFHELGIFLVGQVVSGDMFRPKSDGVAEALFPVAGGLTGDGEHEIDVDVVEPGIPENAERFPGIGRRVISPQEREFPRQPGLDTEADACDAVTAQEFGLCGAAVAALTRHMEAMRTGMIGFDIWNHFRFKIVCEN